MTTRPLGAQISHMLKNRGVDVIFGIPGVHNQEMYRGIEEAGITHVLARHEQGAGFMADGYARATGKPGVAYVITGPGLCNTMTPMGQGYSDSVPMLVISSCLDETAATRGQLHQMKDQEIAAGTVCDWSQTAQTAASAYQLIDRALVEFEISRPRPKHITVPINALETDAVDAPDRRPAATMPTIDLSCLTDVVTALQTARKPLLLLGGGAQNSGARALEVATMTGSAVFSTYAGRGIVPDDYALNFGSALARGSSAKVLAEADLVLAIGTELSEVDLWRDDPGYEVPIIRVDIDPSVVASEVNTEIGVCCDAGAFLAALAAGLSGAGGHPTTQWTAKQVADAKANWRVEVDLERPNILSVVDALKAALPAETMIYSDMTQFAYAALEVYPMDRPRHWHHPSGFGTLGYALPAAIGGKIGVGDQPVISILGDYGFQYTVQEVAVAVELGLTLPIIIWDNGKLGEIEDSMVRAQIAPNAVVQQNPDFCKLAEAYGAASAEPKTLAEFQDVVRTALAADGPTVIRVTPDCKA